MCRRSQIFGTILFSAGAGLIVSSLIDSAAVRIVLGIIMLLIGLAVWK